MTSFDLKMLILSNYSDTKQPTTSVCIIVVEKMYVQVIGKTFYSGFV